MEEMKNEEALARGAEETAQTPAEPQKDTTQENGQQEPEELRRSVGAPLTMDDSDLIGVVGVRFRTAGKSYYFAVGDLPVRRGSHVVVETARGLEYGTSVCDPMNIHQRQFKAPIKKIIRMASEADEKRVRENRAREREAFAVCFEKIREHELDMKLIDAEYTFDSGKLLFYFTSDGRVDFRDLVKDLAGIFHTRIELRQIGVRDETKILGGYGICGRPLCCHTYLSDFVPVSIKMAKEQNLSLNPTKISGSCGRLMCCLKNEEETYEELNKNLPRLGDEVQTAEGISGSVISVDILKQLVRILVEIDDEKEVQEHAADTLTILHRRKRGQAKPKVNRAELKNSGKNARPGGRAAKGREEAEQSERETDRSARPDRAERPERSDRSDRSERNERPERRERTERNGHTDRPEKRETDRSARQDRADRPERSDRSDRTERNERPERKERTDRSERRNRPERAESADRSERRDRSGQTERAENSAERPERRERSANRRPRKEQGEGNAAARPRPESDARESEGENTRRHHRYRRRSSNDRPREEKPSAAE